MNLFDIFESEETFILYFDGKPVATYTNINDAEYQARMVKEKVPNLNFEIKKEVCTFEPVQLKENLRDWFKEKWVRFGPDGKIRGDCARGDDSEGKPKCLPQAKAHALGKKGRATAAARKRREDPNPERSGAAINVKTKESQLDEKCWDTHRQEGMKKKGNRMVPNCVPKESIEEAEMCPECGGPMFTDLVLAEKKDACYSKVRSRYKVWPSAYASGALVQCRKKGAANWGNKSKNESIEEGAGNIGDRIQALYQKIYNAGDDAVEFMYYDSPIFAQYWDEYEGDLDSIIAEVNPQELQVILDELESAAEDQGIAEGKMAELEMDLEDPEITDHQFEKMYGMTRKEAREQFSKTDMWAFPEIRDPDRPLHEKGVAEGANDQVYTIDITRERMMGPSSTRSTSGTLAELIEYFGYTLEVGKSYEHERGRYKINMNPKNIQSLVDNLNKAQTNAAANSNPSTYYSVSEKGVAEGKIKLSTDPNWYGAEVGDYKASGPIVNIPANRLVGFEPDDKMNQPASKANVKKIVAGLKQGAKLPPLLVRQYKNGYQVLDGHHRFWAYKLLDVKSIPAQVVPAKDIEEITKQGVAEGSQQILIKIRKGHNKFATELSVNGKTAGVYQYDANSGRSIAEVYPEYKNKGFGKILVLHAIYAAAKLGMNFVEDESRTAEYDNVLDSLDSNGLAVNDDGYWYVTGEGEQYLKQRLKQGVAETSDYFRRREREEAIISGKKPARKKQPAQTSDYAKRREQEKKQDVAEEAVFGSNFAEQLAQQVFDHNSNLTSEQEILNLGYNIAKIELGRRAQRIFDDEDFLGDYVSAYAYLRKQSGTEDNLNEKWSDKYKRSINCNNPKGFSQKAHCAGRKKQDVNEGAYRDGVNDGIQGTPNPRASSVYGPESGEYQKGYAAGVQRGKEEKSQRAAQHRAELAPYEAMSDEELLRLRKEIQQRSKERQAVYNKLRGSSLSYDPKQHKPKNDAELRAENAKDNQSWHIINQVLSDRGINVSTLEEDDLGTNPKRPARSGARPDRGHKPVPRYNYKEEERTGITQITKDIRALGEGKEYYNVAATAQNVLRKDFKMRKDANGWFLSESATPKQKLDAFRAFGAPKRLEG